MTMGAATGRDGIHGASFASEELTAKSEARRPQVQVGDPFTEKLLLEASLELIASGHIVAIQDMGAAGLTSSSAEMAARGGVGVEIDLATVPTREPGMTPYEILLSESQERMLVVARTDRVAAVQAIAAKWDLTAVPIGRVTDDGMYRCTWGKQVVVEIPGQRLVDDCPIYHPEAKEDPAVAKLRGAVPNPQSPIPNSSVQARTVLPPGGDAGLVRVQGADFALAVTTDCNSRYVFLDPYEGGKAAVAEGARNVACTGARPLGITDCLNFGSPERPEVFHQFREACRGISDACRALGTPVTGGNVSFYNESPTGAIDPTPVVGMVGLLDQASQAVPSHAHQTGDLVFVLGHTTAELGGSAYWEVCRGFRGGQPPRVDLDAERRLVDFLVLAASRTLLHSAHDCSSGGLAVTCAEVAMGGPYQVSGFGLEMDLSHYAPSLPAVDLLYSESQGRAVVTCAPERGAAVLALAQELGVPAFRAGTVSDAGGGVRIALRDGEISHPVERLRDVYFGSLPRRMGD
jgi:phosphoribosylformylglycinamidine synthase